MDELGYFLQESAPVFLFVGGARRMRVGHRPWMQDVRWLRDVKDSGLAKRAARPRGARQTQPFVTSCDKEVRDAAIVKTLSDGFERRYGPPSSEAVKTDPTSPVTHSS